MARVTKIQKKTVPSVESVVSEETLKTKRTLPVNIILAVLLLMAVGSASYFYYQYRNTNSVKEAKEIENLTEEISRTFLLPEGEIPTLATVTDKEKLAGQPFFQKSENGDKVLIYSQSGRAVLYRPSLKKIVDITSVNINPQTAQNTPPAQTTTPGSPTIPAVPVEAQGGATADTLKVALYNGSGKVGATAGMEKELLNFYPKASVIVKETAASEYDDTLAVDLTGKNTVLTESLSFAVKGKVASLPEGEQKPTGADVLVIVGKNR